MGRPLGTEFSQEIADKICDELANGRSLTSICKDETMPTRTTIYTWLKKDANFCAAIAQARLDQADYFFERQIDLAEEASVQNWQLQKFRADQLKWVAGRINNRKYGDKVQTQITGADGGAIQIEAMPSAEMARRLAFIFAQAQLENNKTITQESLNEEL